MDFKKRIIDELKLTSLQADTLLEDYIIVCEKLAKEYHALQLLQTDVSGSILAKASMINALTNTLEVNKRLGNFNPIHNETYKKLIKTIESV